MDGYRAYSKEASGSLSQAGGEGWREEAVKAGPLGGHSVSTESGGGSRHSGGGWMGVCLSFPAGVALSVSPAEQLWMCLPLCDPTPTFRRDKGMTWAPWLSEKAKDQVPFANGEETKRWGEA